MFRLAVLLLVTLSVLVAGMPSPPDHTRMLSVPSIIDNYRGQHSEAVKNAEELLGKFRQGPSKSIYWVGRLQISLHACQSAYDEVHRVERNHFAFSADFYIKKYTDTLKGLENTIQDARAYIKKNWR